jgi:hypothetical protein
MQLNNNLKSKTRIIGVFGLLFGLASCGTYQYAGHEHDSIYGGSNTNVEYQKEHVQENSTSQSSSYYQNYFKEKSMLLDNISQDSIFTDIDSYEGNYDVENDTLNYPDSYAGWGQNTTEVSINVLGGYGGYYGISYGGFYDPFYYGYSGYGYGGYGYGGYGYGGYGYGGYGYGYPYYYGYGHNYYGGHGYYGYGHNYYGNNSYYGGRSIAYVNGRRGSAYSSGVSSLNNRRSPLNSTLSRRSVSSRVTNTNNSRLRRSSARLNTTSSRPRTTATRPRTTITRPRTTTTRPRTTTTRPRTNTSRPRATTTRPRSSHSNNNRSFNRSSSRSSSSVRSSRSSSSRSSSSRSSGRSSGSSRRGHN